MTQMDGLRGNNDARNPHIIRLQLVARQLAETALDFLFPPRCIQCNRAGSLLCVSCQSELPPSPVVCEADSPLRQQRATAIYQGGLRKAIHAFKYENQYSFANVLSQRLHLEYQQASWNATLFTAAPLHPNRLRSRGYNQAALLAERVAQRAGKPFSGTALRRIRETQSQVGLSAQERMGNVADAFEADPSIVSNQHIVIVDDVYTTGATLKSCASALRKAGAAEVWGLTLASAHHDDPT